MLRRILLAALLGLLWARAAFGQAAAPPGEPLEPREREEAPASPSPAVDQAGAEAESEPVRAEAEPTGAEMDRGAPSPAPSPSESEAIFAQLENELSGSAKPSAAEPSSKPGAPPALGARGFQSLNPDLSFVLDFALAAFSKRENLQTGEHDPHQTGPAFQNFELNARSVVDPYFRFEAAIVFDTEGVEVEEAYGTTTSLPAGLQARFGKFFTRFGRLSSMHPHSWDFVDQPFALGRVFGSEGSGGLGVELSWLLPLPWYVELVGTATSAAGETSARSFYGDEDLGIESPADVLYIGALKQFFDLSDDWSLLWGLSGAFGPNSTERGNRTEVYATDLYVKYRPITRASYTTVSWHTEVLHRRRQVPGALELDVSGFSQLVFRFARRWSTAARYEFGSPTFDRDFKLLGSTLDPEWTAERHRVAVNLTHHPSEFSRLRLQASRDMPRWSDSIWAVFLAAEIAVGAHGAHPF